MKVLYSDALRTPGDWHEVDARDFASLPNYLNNTTVDLIAGGYDEALAAVPGD